MINQVYRPLGNRVLLKPLPQLEEERKIGEIHLTDMSIILERAEVVAVGRGETSINTGDIIPMETKIGDVVLIRKEGAYLPIMSNGSEHKLVRENDIEAIVGAV